MMKQFFSVLAVLVLGLSACKKDESTTTNLTLTFTPNYGTKQLDSADSHLIGDALSKFSRYTLFLSDITLVAENGTEHLLSEVEFLNFNEDTDATTLMETINRTYAVPNAKYKSLKLGYGVKPSLNAKNPSQFPVDHVLAIESGQYWDSWRSYIFMKIEARGASPSYPDIPMSYHCGADPVYVTDTKAINLDLRGEAKQTDFVIDIAQIFNDNGEWLDVGASPATHSQSDLKLGEKLMKRLPYAVQIK